MIKFFENFTFKQKVISLIVGLLLLSSITISWSYVDKTREVMSKELKYRGIAITQSLTYGAPYGILLESEKILNKLITGTMNSTDIKYLIILDTNGKVLAHSNTRLNGAYEKDNITAQAISATNLIVQEYTSPEGDFYYDIAAPVFGTNRENGKVRVGTIRLGVSNKIYEEKIIEFIKVTIVWSAILLTLGIAIAIYVLNLIVLPLKEMGEISQKIADGNFTQAIVVKSNDEIGQLGSAFLKMETKLKSILGHIKTVSSSLGSVSENIHLTAGKVLDGAKIQASSAEETKKSVQNMNLSIMEITSNVESLSAISSDSSAAVLQMSASIKEVAKHSSILSHSVEETGTSIAEMNTSIETVAEHAEVLSDNMKNTSNATSNISCALVDIKEKAKESASLSQKVTDNAENYGLMSINKTIKGMEEIKKTISTATEVIDRLGHRSNRIGKVLTVIDEVTKQTNLLALNAAILAAQAGEQGKGFAVVADEIKNLADRTDASTHEISELITAVQNETKEAIDSIKNGEISVDNGMKVSLEAGDALKKILESSKQASTMSRAIENLTYQQVTEISSIAESVVEASEMAVQISTATNKQTKNAGMIKETSIKMQEIAQLVSKSTTEQSKTSELITQSVENISDKIFHIVESVRTQKKGTESIMVSIENINETSKTSVELSSEMSSTVDFLTQQADDLELELGKFKIS